MLKNEIHRGMLARIGGVFTFVNIIWFFAIFGIAASLGPLVWVLSTPIRQFFVVFLTWFARKIKEFFWYAIWPNLVRLHTWGIFEILCYVFTYAVLTEAFRMNGTVGFFVAITAFALLVVCFCYSLFLWGQDKIREISYFKLVGFLMMYLFACSIPTVLYLKSDF